MNLFDAVLSVLLIFSSMIKSVNAASNLTSTCGQTTFTADSGRISFGPRSGSSGKHCTYSIKVRTGRRIVLEWSKFVVDGDMPRCGSSNVQVYIGYEDCIIAFNFICQLYANLAALLVKFRLVNINLINQGHRKSNVKSISDSQRDEHCYNRRRL